MSDFERGRLPSSGFTIIDNAWLRDARLSWKAKGLLAYLASHAEGYRLTRDQIVAQAIDGRDAVLSGLRELEETGYLERVKARGEGGKIERTIYRLGSPLDDHDGSPTSGKPGPGADQGEHGVSAGETTDGFSGSGQPAGKKTNHEKTKEKTNSSASPRRGTRVPEDFAPDESLRSWYAEKIGAAINGLAEHERFMDYWRSQPGQKGVKTDWPATWRNWMRTALERSGGRAPGAAPQAASKPRYPSAAERAAEQSRTEYEQAKAAEDWLEANGGNPEDNAQVRAVIARMKSGELGSASRTPMPYIEGEIVRDNGATREVTSHASE